MHLQDTAGRIAKQPSSGRLLLEGGQERVAFLLKIRMAKLEATFNYELADAPPLAIVSVQVSQ